MLDTPCSYVFPPYKYGCILRMNGVFDNGSEYDPAGKQR